MMRCWHKSNPTVLNCILGAPLWKFIFWEKKYFFIAINQMIISLIFFMFYICMFVSMYETYGSYMWIRGVSRESINNNNMREWTCTTWYGCGKTKRGRETCTLDPLPIRHDTSSILLSYWSSITRIHPSRETHLYWCSWPVIGINIDKPFKLVPIYGFIPQRRTFTSSLSYLGGRGIFPKSVMSHLVSQQKFIALTLINISMTRSLTLLLFRFPRNNYVLLLLVQRRLGASLFCLRRRCTPQLMGRTLVSIYCMMLIL